MNKAELIEAVATKAVTTKTEVQAVLNVILGIIIEAVASGDKVTLIGFGCFEARQRKAREGHNPGTGEKIHIPATVVPAFSAGKDFRTATSLTTATDK